MEDPELQALGQITAALDALSENAQQRVLAYVNDRYGRTIEYAVLDETEPTITPHAFDAIAAMIDDSFRPVREAFSEWRRQFEDDGR